MLRIGMLRHYDCKSDFTSSNQIPMLQIDMPYLDPPESNMLVFYTKVIR